MNDLDDLRPPDARPAPDELRQRISADLARAARPPRLRSVVVAAAVLAILTGLVVAGLTWGPRPEPAAPSMGTLDVRTLSNEEAQRRLTSCLAELADTPERELPPAADWNLRYARMQYWRVEQLGDDQGSLVVLATSAAGVLRCTEQNSELSSPEPDLLSSPAALVTDDEPVLGCPGAVGDSVPAVLLKTRPTVRMARVRLTIDREPGRWWTAGAQGGFVHLPLVDAAQPTALAEAGQLSYEVQALDAKNAPVPITYPAGPEGGATTYVHEIASCADRAGQGVRPAKPAAAAEECTRLTRIAVRNGGPTAYRWRPVLDGADRQLWLSLPPDGDGVLCSLAPVRGVRLLSHGTSLEDQQGAAAAKDHLYFSLTDLGERGIYLWSGGVLDEPVSSITYTFPGGKVARAVVGERSWVLSYRTDRPLLDGRPLDQLPPVEVDVTLPSGRTVHHTPFPSPRSPPAPRTCRRVPVRRV